MQSFTPYYVEMSTVFKKGDDERQYNHKAKANENFINQNFKGQTDEIAYLKSKVATLEAAITILQGGS